MTHGLFNYGNNIRDDLAYPSFKPGYHQPLELDHNLGSKGPALVLFDCGGLSCARFWVPGWFNPPNPELLKARDGLHYLLPQDLDQCPAQRHIHKRSQQRSG